MSALTGRVLEASDERIRPLRTWTAAALERVRGTFEEAWRAWCDRWSLVAGEVLVDEAFHADGIAATVRWRALDRSGLWVGATDAEPDAALAAALFGPAGGKGATDDTRSLATDAAGRALEDWAAMLPRAGGPSARADDADAAPGPDVWARWSGALHLVLSARGADDTPYRQRLVLDATVARADATARSRHPAPTDAPLERVVDAVGTRRVALAAYLDPVRLTIGALQSLHPGDVVPLTHRLDAPLQVVGGDPGADPVPVCAAYLGAMDGCRAIELVLLNPNTLANGASSS